MPINIAIAVITVLFVIRGARKGVFLQILTTLGTVVSFLAAWRYCGLAQQYCNVVPASLNPFAGNPVFGKAATTYINEMAWFFILFIGMRLCFRILEKLAEGLSSLPVIKEFSMLLGGALGLVNAGVWILVAATLLHTPLFANGDVMAEKTVIQSITDKAAEVSEAAGAPVLSSETFSRIYHNALNLDDRDKEFLANWLKEHGLEPINTSPAATLPENLTIDGKTYDEQEISTYAEELQNHPEEIPEEGVTVDGRTYSKQEIQDLLDAYQKMQEAQ